MKVQEYETYWSYRSQDPNYGNGLFNIPLSAAETAAYTQYYTAQANYQTITGVDATSNTISFANAHGFTTGQAVIYTTGGDNALAIEDGGSLVDGATYYVIATADPTKLQLATNQANALAGVAINLAADPGIAQTQGLKLANSADIATYVQNALTTLTNARDQEYRTLDAEYGSLGSSFNASWVDPASPHDFLSATEEAAIRASVKVWTPDELLYAFGAGLLKPITDTQVTDESPNITGHNVTIITNQGGVGVSDGVQIINIPAGGAATLSTDDQVALTAAERADVTYVGISSTAQVNFTTSTTSGGTITRTDGGSWITDGFQAGMSIQINGSFVAVDPVNQPGKYLDTNAPANATQPGKYYVIQSVTASTITLSPLSGALSMVITSNESGKNITVSQLIDPTAPSTSAHISKILIDLRDDINLDITGDIDITAGANVYIGAGLLANDFYIDHIDAGQTVRVKSRGGIYNVATSGTNIVSEGLILEAAASGIGTSIDPLTIVLDNPTSPPSLATLVARAYSDIYVTAPSGNINVESVYSAAGGVYLTSQTGSILDGLNNSFTKIMANQVELSAPNGSVGVAGDSLAEENSGTLKVTAKQDVRIAENSANMMVDSITSLQGTVELTANLSILNAHAPSDTSPDVTGESVVLISLLGNIGATGNDIYVITDNTTATPGTLTSSSYGDTHIIKSTGDLYLNTVSTIAGTAFISTPAGSILNGSATGENIESGATYLFASLDIGSESKPLRTTGGSSTAKIQGKATTGSVWVMNTGAMEVGGVVDDPQGFTAGGEISMTTGSPLEFSQSMTAPIIYLQALDTPGETNTITVDSGATITSTNTLGIDMYLIAGNDVVLKAGSKLVSATGVQILVGGNITVEAGALVNASGNILLKGSDSETVLLFPVSTPHPGVGSIITINGDLVAPVVNIYGGNDADTITISKVDSMTNIYGGGGDDQITVNQIPS